MEPQMAMLAFLHRGEHRLCTHRVEVRAALHGQGSARSRRDAALEWWVLPLSPRRGSLQ